MSNRRIESPDLNSDIELAPSGTKRAKVSHSGGIIIGSNSNDSSNVKLHRAAADKLEIVVGNDTTAEGTPVNPANLASLGMKGMTVNYMSSSESVIGTSPTASDNIKLRRGGSGNLEVVTSDESSAEGTPTYTKRTNVQLGSVTVGSSATPSQNIKLHRAQAGMLEFIEGDSTTSDGSEAIGVKSSIFVKSVSIGSGTNGTGSKIFRSGPQELECSSEDATTVDGTRNPVYRSYLNYKGSIIGGHGTESSNVRVHRGAVGELELTKGDDTTSEGTRSSNKVQMNVNGLMVGSDATVGNNAKLHRGSSKELEVVDGSTLATEVDGTRSSNKAQINVKAISVGGAGNATHGDNVKFRRGNINEVEVVASSDTTIDNTRSANKVQINTKDIMIGSDAAVLGNNVKLHRSGAGELEVLVGSANATTLDGSSYPLSRAKLAAESISLGKSSVVGENAKLHRYINTAYAVDEAELEVVAGDDVTVDGVMASSGKKNLNVKGLSVGQSATSSQNPKLHRGGNGILEVVTGDDITSDGLPSVNKTQLNAKNIHLGSSTTDSENVKLHRGAASVVQVVGGNDSTSEGTLSTALSQLSFKFESYADGSKPLATSQEGRGVWNTTFKYIELSNGVSWKVLGENKSVSLVENAGFTAAASVNTMVVSLKNQEGNDPVNGASVRLAYRSPTSASGSWLFRTANAAQSLTISSGATLGTSNNLKGRIYVYLIDNAGSLELAVSQKYYSGDSLVNTVAMSAASDLVGVVYSTSERTGVPIVSIGYFDSTQTVAGTWVNSPSKIHIGNMGSKFDRDMSSSVASIGDVAVSNAVSQTITTKATVTNLSVSLTTSGKPVRLVLNPGTSGGIGTPGHLKLYCSSSDYYHTGKIYLYRDGAEISVFDFGSKTTTSLGGEEIYISPAVVDYLDNATAGVYNYTVSAEAYTNNVLDISNVKLVAYEL